MEDFLSGIYFTVLRSQAKQLNIKQFRGITKSELVDLLIKYLKKKEKRFIKYPNKRRKYKKVTMNQEGGSEVKSEWKLHVEHSTTRCGNAQRQQLTAKATGLPRNPGPNYELVSGLGYYKFHSNTITWAAAQETCAREGAHLLILNSDEEFKAIKNMWDKYPKIATDWRNSFIHVGLTDHVQEKEFYTIFGKLNKIKIEIKLLGENVFSCSMPKRHVSFYGDIC
ncbi:hypothetical protein L9F63_000613 [Diploptera punctata]|uniref:C-type lectin domain-containing protein n=1 Tax=Diploptera punctata TaxID=6984 RepID=A0AAD8ALC7_DIPPU|nr:hypothetical protein L9F63_000613 [Diploptera punctata]